MAVFGKPLEHDISGSLLVSRHCKKYVKYHKQVVLALHGTLDQWVRARLIAETASLTE